MSVFVQKHNPITGNNDWIVQEENYDFHQEVARSAFADMLHDTERNQKYEAALKSAIEIMHSKGKKANVLDIGTGTGLLSMMAVRNGADTVIACEAFAPMSECALKVIKTNGYQDRIKVIPKRSTDLKVHKEEELPDKCNILVTEIFDTELIGEGALSTFNHAHKNLLEEDCIVVPQTATIYAQVVESSLVQSWNKVKDVYDNEGKLLIKVPSKIKKCAGSAAVHDIQLNQLKLETVKFITRPVPVFKFDWSTKNALAYDQSISQHLKAECGGVAQAIFMWWDLEMDTTGSIILSCAPYWAHPLQKSSADLPWRDHWMQAIYYLPHEIHIQKDSYLNLISCHDEYSLWFNISNDLNSSNKENVKPICRCGLHVAFSRTRIGQLNDTIRNKKYLKLLEENVNRDSVLLVLSDGFYLSLAAAKLSAKAVYYVETNSFSRKILIDFITDNEISNVEVFENIEMLQNSGKLAEVNLVFGEPYFVNSILPWDHLLFIYLLKGVNHTLSPNMKVFPQTAIIRAVAVHFKDLNKIRLPLRDCQGFAMKDFDDIIETSSNISDDNVEAQPLWEYPCTALSHIMDICTIDSNDVPEKNLEVLGTFKIESREKCNGVALWVDWVFGKDDETVICSGPILQTQIDKKIEWDVHTRQGVCLFSEKCSREINYTFKFDFNEGNITFKIS